MSNGNGTLQIFAKMLGIDPGFLATAQQDVATFAQGLVNRLDTIQRELHLAKFDIRGDVGESLEALRSELRDLREQNAAILAALDDMQERVSNGRSDRKRRAGNGSSHAIE